MPKQKSSSHGIEEQFEAIVEAYDENKTSFAEAITEVMEGAPSHLSCHEVADPGEAVELTEPTEEAAFLERIIGASNLLPVHFLEEGASVQRAVGRVALKQAHAGLPAGSGWGTGFLVSNSILMTNNHVIPSKAFANKVKAEFNYQLDHTGAAETVDAWDLDPDSLFYTNAALDFTIVRIKCRRLVVNIPWKVRNAVPALNGGFDGEDAAVEISEADLTAAAAGLIPSQIYRLCHSPGPKWGRVKLPTGSVGYWLEQRLNVVQHPRGRRKEVALQSNTLDRLFTNAIRYTADTEPGSSGSPVFTNAWDLVAIHHAGGDFTNGQWVNNEGMRMDKIVADLRNQFPAGNSVRSELAL